MSGSLSLLDALMEEVRERIKASAVLRPPKWNWVEKRTIALIHIDELSNQSPLGLFIELQCSRDPTARRLVPAPVDHVHSALSTEYVRGALWMYPAETSVDIPVSAQELSDLRLRFWELLDELNG
jgi:hypothetical protein